MTKTLSTFVAAISLIAFIPTVALANSGDFSGGVAIGTGYAGVDTAPTNGLAVQGHVGIGTTSPAYLLHDESSGESPGEGCEAGYDGSRAAMRDLCTNAITSDK